jgi:integrase
MTKRGKVYDVHFRIVTLDGIEKQKKLSGYSTKALAKQAHLEFITEYCELVKNNPLKKKNPDKEELIVGELVREYISKLGNHNKDSVIYEKQNTYKTFILSKFEKTKLSALTKEVISAWQDELWSTRNPKTGNFYSYNYLSKIRGLFGSFLSWCQERYPYTNPLPKIKKPKRRVPKKQMQFWTREEFDKFISVVDNPRWHCFFTMLFYTGRRKGEILALTPSDIKKNAILFDKSITRKTIDGSVYNITSTKADKIYETPICTTLKEELKNYQGEAPFFFGGKKPLSETTITRVFDDYAEKAGVKRIRLHDLRHSFVSMCIHLGANFLVVADLIGDTVEQVTKTYGHLYISDKVEIINKIG